MADAIPRIPSENGEPAWEAAFLHSPQGNWSEEEFLQFHTSQLAELVDGRSEILPRPNLKHQRMLRMLLGLVERAAPAGGFKSRSCGADERVGRRVFMVVVDEVTSPLVGDSWPRPLRRLGLVATSFPC